MDLRAPLVTDSPFFYIALAVMIIGTFFFLTGFLAELGQPALLRPEPLSCQGKVELKSPEFSLQSGQALAISGIRNLISVTVYCILPK
ncbi:MAG: hypothetical protein MZU84_00645 [Sphingobacterium sp.]|nr:hypothetical protein [Sphingobacterium sp.]